MYLHEAIVIILKENEGTLTTREIADELNSRQLYTKKDGSPITDFQVHGRTKNYTDHRCQLKDFGLSFWATKWGEGFCRTLDVRLAISTKTPA